MRKGCKQKKRMRKAHVRWYLGGAAGLGAALFGAGLVMLNPFMLGDPRVMFELYALGNRYPAQYALIAVALFAVGSAVLLSYFFYENRFYDDMKCNEDEELYDRLYGQHKQLIDGIRREAF
ncbi:MAG: hypothetical protein FWF01_00140, partial [Alphaproteobacteria bacterium]|nr:hypothetical protein [Alphaproteobacteria bacterium]